MVENFSLPLSVVLVGYIYKTSNMSWYSLPPKPWMNICIWRAGQGGRVTKVRAWVGLGDWVDLYYTTSVYTLFNISPL